jgi:hypothetical protein
MYTGRTREIKRVTKITWRIYVKVKEEAWRKVCRKIVRDIHTVKQKE